MLSSGYDVSDYPTGCKHYAAPVARACLVSLFINEAGCEPEGDAHPTRMTAAHANMLSTLNLG